MKRRQICPALLGLTWLLLPTLAGHQQKRAETLERSDLYHKGRVEDPASEWPGISTSEFVVEEMRCAVILLSRSARSPPVKDCEGERLSGFLPECYLKNAGTNAASGSGHVQTSASYIQILRPVQKATIYRERFMLSLHYRDIFNYHFRGIFECGALLDPDGSCRVSERS